MILTAQKYRPIVKVNVPVWLGWFKICRDYASYGVYASKITRVFLMRND